DGCRCGGVRRTARAGGATRHLEGPARRRRRTGPGPHRPSDVEGTAAPQLLLPPAAHGPGQPAPRGRRPHRACVRQLPGPGADRPGTPSADRGAPPTAGRALLPGQHRLGPPRLRCVRRALVARGGSMKRSLVNLLLALLLGGALAGWVVHERNQADSSGQWSTDELPYGPLSDRVVNILD